MPKRAGYRGGQVGEFLKGSGRRVAVGIYWTKDDGEQGEPLVFQVVELDTDGQIASIQDYRRRERALRAAAVRG